MLDRTHAAIRGVVVSVALATIGGGCHRSEPPKTEASATRASTVAKRATCTPLAWTEGDLPDAVDKKELSGTIKVVREKSHTGESVDAIVLALDEPICDSTGKPAREIQVGEGKLAEYLTLAGERTTIAFDEFITARSDEVHVRGVVGMPSDEPATATAAKCTPLAWTKRDQWGVDHVRMSGTLIEGSFADRGPYHRFFTFRPDTPLCDWNGSSTSEVQVVPPNTALVAKGPQEVERVNALVGKRVTVTGRAEEATSKQDHLPVVVHGEIVRELMRR